MECGSQRETTETQTRDLSKAFMFTEEQITKQLVDMREQTDFMRKFRGALGIALREIKTLRTTSTLDQSKHETESSIPRKRHSSCSLPSTLAGADLSPPSDACVPSAPARNATCICADFGQTDLTILKEYLAKMALDDGSNVNTKLLSSKVRETVKSAHQQNVGKMKDSQSSIEHSICHIEKLKEHVAQRNAAVIRLCQQLTQARLLRIKRETKLDEKLREIVEWKTKYEKMKKQNEKQVKITKGLRLTLNAEKQRVKSSQNMAHGLEETRRAFESLKSQAGQLMALLSDKECEIAQLTAKIQDLEESNKNSAYFAVEEKMMSQRRVMPEIHGVPSANSCSTNAESQTDFVTCGWCDRSRKEQEALQDRYDRLHADFEQYRRAHRAWDESHQSASDSFSPYTMSDNVPRSQLNHPYGRRRMHAPYTSPDSYRRVSRPPLRRRLSREAENRIGVAGSPNTQSHAPHQRHHDGLLSPIEEQGESYNHASNEKASHFTSETVENDQNCVKFGSSTVPNFMPDVYQSYIASKQEAIDNTGNRGKPHNVHDHNLHDSARPTGEVANGTVETSSSTKPDELTISPKRDSGISSIQDSEEMSVQSSVESKSYLESPDRKSENHETLTKASYLEVGTSATPSPNGSVNSARDTEYHEHPQLCLNSFIRYNDAEDTASEQSSLPHDDLDFPEERNLENSLTTDPETNPLTFGVVWHPALIKSEDEYQNKSDIRRDTAAEKNSSTTASSFNPLLRHSDVIAVQGTTAHKNNKVGRRSRCVTYKGHKIDVTDFSIHTFRDIIWSLDEGPDSADDFIKFLASLAKKLNASAKWTGKHSMGSPEDWLALRGLY